MLFRSNSFKIPDLKNKFIRSVGTTEEIVTDEGTFTIGTSVGGTVRNPQSNPAATKFIDHRHFSYQDYECYTDSHIVGYDPHHIPSIWAHLGTGTYGTKIAQGGDAIRGATSRAVDPDKNGTTSCEFIVDNETLDNAKEPYPYHMTLVPLIKVK